MSCPPSPGDAGTAPTPPCGGGGVRAGGGGDGDAAPVAGRAQAGPTAPSGPRAEPGTERGAERARGGGGGRGAAERCRATTTSCWSGRGGGCCARSAGSPCGSPSASPPAATASATPACRSSSGETPHHPTGDAICCYSAHPFFPLGVPRSRTPALPDPGLRTPGGSGGSSPLSHPPPATGCGVRRCLGERCGVPWAGVGVRGAQGCGCPGPGRECGISREGARGAWGCGGPGERCEVPRGCSGPRNGCGMPREKMRSAPGNIRGAQGCLGPGKGAGCSVVPRGREGVRGAPSP